LIVTEEGFEDTRSAAEYEKLSIVRFLNCIAEEANESLPKHQMITPEFISSLCAGSIESKRLNPMYSLVNVQDYQRVVVGSIVPGKITLTQEILFPGGEITPPGRDMVQIPFSIAGPYEPSGYKLWLRKYLNGVTLAKLHINDANLFPDIFPNHEPVFHEIKIGVMKTTTDYITEGLEAAVETNTLGFAQITSWASTAAMGIMRV
jgi:hypothetical protein